MSRFSDYEGDGDDNYNGNGWAMWEKRAELALGGKRGRKALTDLREALLALPDKRLVQGALCTVGVEARVRDDGDQLYEMVAEQGEGVCAIGAYVWWQKVKGGMAPDEAFAALPTVPDFDGDGGSETARIGKDHGLTYTLAWELASQNDEQFVSMTPEARYVAFLLWIDNQLAKPPLRAPERGRKARLRAAREAARAEVRAHEQRRHDAAVGQDGLGLV